MENVLTLVRRYLGMEEQSTEAQPGLPAANDEKEKHLNERRELLDAFRLVQTSMENSTIAGKIAVKYTAALEIVAMFRDGLEQELRGQ